ncbi:BOX PROTEIN putative-RELATED [Salix viminalis]|uniref:BOX PROTEIN putative-RELATED n=1 Tax=Salix viminalis TaxID=40686 RepID=A0A9Q0TPS6_SALVM|nr:BOX PROTEIN putative-RELATED [Salix viminalis]
MLYLYITKDRTIVFCLNGSCPVVSLTQSMEEIRTTSMPNYKRKKFLTRDQASMSFSKRTKTLKKKAHEIQTLCDVRVCMVCFGPDSTRPDMAGGSCGGQGFNHVIQRESVTERNTRAASRVICRIKR